MTGTGADRVLDQRLRSSMMERLLYLVDWEEALARGADEYFNTFFDIFPDEPPLRPNSALTNDEHKALTTVLELMDTAANSTPQHVSEAELIASGWPERIKPAAQAALTLMTQRGKFSEELEEDEPSSSIPL